MNLEEFDKLCDALEKRLEPIVNRVVRHAVRDEVKEPLEDHEKRVRRLEGKAAYMAGGIAAAILIATWAVYLVAG